MILQNHNLKYDNPDIQSAEQSTFSDEQSLPIFTILLEDVTECLKSGYKCSENFMIHANKF